LLKGVLQSLIRSSSGFRADTKTKDKKSGEPVSLLSAVGADLWAEQKTALGKAYSFLRNALQSLARTGSGFRDSQKMALGLTLVLIGYFALTWTNDDKETDLGTTTAKADVPSINTKPPSTVLWEFETGGDVDSSPAIGSDGTVYVGSDDNNLYAINGKSGVKLWEFETEGRVTSSPAIGSDGTVYVGSDDGKLYAINGKRWVKLWEFETGGPVLSSPAIGSDGTVYVGSVDKKLYAINGKSGVKLWEFETGGYVYSSPTIRAHGAIYIGSKDNKVYAFATSSKGPAQSPWPMRGQNAQHTGRARK
jgi:hypothetical protein